MSDSNLERIGEAFFAAEKAEGLVQWRVGNVSLWPVIRSRLLKAMTKNSRMYTQDGRRAFVPDHMKTYKGRSPAKLLWKKLNFLPVGAVGEEPNYKTLRNADVLILPPKDRGLDGTEDASAAIREQHPNAFVLGSGIWDEVSTRPHTNELSDIFWDRYSFIARVAARLIVTDEDKARYAKAVKALEAFAPLNPYNRFPYWMVSKHLAERWGYTKLLKLMPKLSKVFVPGNESPSLVAAAKRRGIAIVDYIGEQVSANANEDPFITELRDAYLKVAEEQKLADWMTRDLPYWSIFRSRVLRVMIRNYRLANPDASKVRVPDHLKTYRGRPPVKLLWAAVNRLPLKSRQGEPSFKNLRQLKHLIVPFATRDSEGIDKFSQPVIELLADESLVFGIGQWDQVSPRVRIEDLERFFRNRYRLWAKLAARAMVSTQHKAKYARAVRILEESGAKLEPFDEFPFELLEAFLAERRGFRKLLRRCPNLKTIYMVNAARMSFIAAAHERGIKVIEIQSGVFSKYSLQFSWPGSPKVDYIPDEILTWGDYWTEGIERASQQTVRIIGSTEEFEQARNTGYKRIKGQVVFLSQPLVGLNLLKVAIEFARARKDLDVIFKLHPRNLIVDFKDYAAELGGLPKNLSMMQTERSSLEVIAESEIAVGVFSTALIEAAGLDTKVAIVKLPGWEHLSPLVHGGHAGAFDTVEELLAGIDSLPKSREGEYFYGKRADWHEVLGVPATR